MGPRHYFTELLRRVRRRRAKRRRAKRKVKDAEQWVGLRELSKLTGVSYDVLRQAAWRQRVPGFRKSGGIWLGTKAAVDRAVREGKMRGRDA